MTLSRTARVLSIVAVSSLFVAARAAAADATTKTMTLQEAIDYAHAHQPKIAEARARIAAAQATAKIANGQWGPSIGALAEVIGGTANNSTASYVGTGLIDIPRIGATPSITSSSSSAWKPYGSTFVGVGITQELFDFGRIAAQRVALETFVDVERYRADAERLDVDLAVREAFFAVEGARSVVAAADAAYDRAKVHRDFAKAGVDNQLREPIELARAEADLARFDVGRIRARGGLDLARAVFAAAVGSPDASLDAAGSIPGATALPPLETAIQEASQRDPILKETLAEVRAREAETSAIGAEMRPNVSLTATLSGRAGGAPPTSGGVPTGNGFLPVVPNWDVGIVISIPFFDGVVSAREDASKAKEDAARAELDVRKSEEVAQIRRAYAELQIALATVPALEQSLAAAKITYAQAEARFKGGLGSSVEVADAEAVLTDADIELALGRFEAARARAVFGRSIAEGL